MSCDQPAAPARFGDSKNAIISDQVHNGGTRGFVFLPPLVPVTAYGIFKAGQSPEVTIEELAPGTRGTIATFAKSSGTFGAMVKEDDAVGQYQVNWDTKLYTLDPSLTYRIHVKVDGAELGFADVDVVSSGAQLRNVETAEYIPLLDGRTLPIKFRIEQEAASCEGVVCTALDECHEAGICNPSTGVSEAR